MMSVFVLFIRHSTLTYKLRTCGAVQADGNGDESDDNEGTDHLPSTI